jgi:hypothetical protein
MARSDGSQTVDQINVYGDCRVVAVFIGWVAFRFGRLLARFLGNDRDAERFPACALQLRCKERLTGSMFCTNLEGANVTIWGIEEPTPPPAKLVWPLLSDEGFGPYFCCETVGSH